MLKGKRLTLSGLLVAVLAVTGFWWWSWTPSPLLVRWVMVNVNGHSQQGDAHLLQYGPGRASLIDLGHASESPALIDGLRRAGVSSIDTIWISHGHMDHYGGLLPLLRAGFSVGEVRFNPPSPEQCRTESPWGCLPGDLDEIRSELATRKIPMVPIRSGDTFQLGPGVSLNVLYAFDGKQTPIGATDINDTSAILLLVAGSSRVLFTGDLNQRMGRYLAERGQGIQADIIKLPHHGTESLAPDVFFEKVGAKIALVPSPAPLWKSDRSKRPRSYWERPGMRAYVNGVDGEISVGFEAESFRVLSGKRR